MYKVKVRTKNRKQTIKFDNLKKAYMEYIRVSLAENEEVSLHIQDEKKYQVMVRRGVS